MNTFYTRANQPLEQIAVDLTHEYADGAPVTLTELMIEGGLATDAAAAQAKVKSTGRKLAGYLTRFLWERNRVKVGAAQKMLWTPPRRNVTAADSPSPLVQAALDQGATLAEKSDTYTVRHAAQVDPDAMDLDGLDPADVDGMGDVAARLKERFETLIPDDSGRLDFASTMQAALDVLGPGPHDMAAINDRQV